MCVCALLHWTSRASDMHTLGTAVNSHCCSLALQRPAACNCPVAVLGRESQEVTHKTRGWMAAAGASGRAPSTCCGAPWQPPLFARHLLGTPLHGPQHEQALPRTGLGWCDSSNPPPSCPPPLQAIQAYALAEPDAVAILASDAGVAAVMGHCIPDRPRLLSEFAGGGLGAGCWLGGWQGWVLFWGGAGLGGGGWNGVLHSLFFLFFFYIQRA